jgi:hypothetical protein
MWLISRVLARALAAGILAWSVLQVAPAVANTYDVTFTGSAFDVSAVINTSSTLDALRGYDITSISGTVTGLLGGVPSGAIGVLMSNPGQQPGTEGTYYAGSYGWNYDNVLFAGAIPFDNNGVLFSFGSGILGNIYSVGSTFYFSVDNPSQYWDPGDVGSLQVSPTPIPGTLWLFATGLGLVGWVGWRRQHHKVELSGA